MFADLPDAVAARMRELAEVDERDRDDGTPQARRLRQIPPETGQFLAILCASAPPGEVIEIGASAGYSALWLSLACRATGRHLETYEVDPAKVALARETFALTRVDDVVDLIEGDFRAVTALDPQPVGFCFLDAEKDVYDDCYDLVVPRLVSGGLLVCDNVISHADALGALVDRAEADDRVDSVVVPIGKGELLVRRRGA
ncbi:MAG TPA: class I SAM-dependent methyltransferase [Acidimicrobiales bacterium]|nr:class I SAM-dependent methyltransferase [Acidimicrobiales bacterium]